MSAELRFSLIVPVFNEVENVPALLDEISSVLAALGAFEVLIVDDASTDGTQAALREWQRAHAASWLRLLRLARNSGQSAAVLAGVERARAPLVLTMDGDLQNDPRDLQRMLEILEAGDYAGVTGSRERRQDSLVRRWSSRIGNAVRNWTTGDRVRDAACGIKGFRRSVFLAVPRFNGMHRFMATLVRQAGNQVLEIPVTHRPRRAGEAKYGIGNRALRGLRDCLAVRWLRDRQLDFAVREEE